MKYKLINDTLKTGFNLHCFRSGGGLRVLRLERILQGENKSYYAESYNFYDALRILEDDIIAGGRKYSDVYGVIEEYYLTGSFSSGENLDTWVCGGKPLDILFNFDTNRFIIDMSTKEDIHAPQEIVNKVHENNIPIYWKTSHINRIFKSEQYVFADNSIGCSTSTIPSRNGIEANNEMVTFPRLSYGDTFEDVLEAAEKVVDVKFEFEWEELSDIDGILHELYNLK